MPDPLPSWRDGTVKGAIVEFVERVTREGGPDYVPPTARVAAFGHDGTLLCEYPQPVQAFFALHRLEQLAANQPALRQRPSYKALFERDACAVARLGKQSLVELCFAIRAGETHESFERAVHHWLTHFKHPLRNRLLFDCVYKPQLELLSYLHASGFKNFIVSAAGSDLIRVFAEESYGIPPEQVIGSSARTRFELRDRRAFMVHLAELESFDDGEAKPRNIVLHVGRRPILAFGNSDGDLAMLRYALTGTGARLAMLLHHDDAEREFAYDRDYLLSPLTETLDLASEYGITKVSMKSDWHSVFLR